jgi:hypothetical protein
MVEHLLDVVDAQFQLMEGQRSEFDKSAVDAG